jgi:hypothetical protein
MIVVNAHINQVSDFNRIETERIETEIKALGVEAYIDVSTVKMLLYTLKIYSGHTILLFTNFSPNYYFKNNGIDMNEFEVEAIPNWRVENYSFSAALYHHICQEYPIIAVHFITSVLKRVVNDTDFLNVTGGIHTTVMRKQDWMKRGMNYEVNLKGYMFHKIREAKKSISAKYVNGEFSLNNPLLQFCQN